MSHFPPACFLIMIANSLYAGDLNAVKAEPDPNRRSERALDNAYTSLDDAREDLRGENHQKLDAALREIGDSADLCYDSLTQSHQKPHRSKYYKHAELRLRELARMIAGFADQLPLDQRDAAVELQKHVQDIHDKILADELEKK